jgi:hypothetical protein
VTQSDSVFSSKTLDTCACLGYPPPPQIPCIPQKTAYFAECEEFLPFLYIFALCGSKVKYNKSEDIKAFLDSLRDVAKCSDEALGLLLNQLEKKDLSLLTSGLRKVQQHKQLIPNIKKRKTKTKKAQNTQKKEEENKWLVFYTNIRGSVLDLKHHEGALSLIPDLGNYFREDEKGQRCLRASVNLCDVQYKFDGLSNMAAQLEALTLSYHIDRGILLEMGLLCIKAYVFVLFSIYLFFF